MKRLICICLALILLAATPAIVTGIAVTGNELKEAADKGEKDPSSMEEGFFLGYVVGVTDETTTKLCFPIGSTNAQAEEVVRKYLNDHPEELHLDAFALVIDAIQAAWPCK